MKTLYFFIAILLFVPLCSDAQELIHTKRRRTGKPVKDSLQMTCLLQDAVEAPPKKKAYEMGVEQPMLRMTSTTDSLVKAGLTGTVSIVQSEGKGKMEVVYYFQDYYVWVSGLSKVNVVKNQKLKPDDIIGTLSKGDVLEIIITDYDTPVDPKKYINCGLQAVTTQEAKK
jgi:hypothetical protein